MYKLAQTTHVIVSSIPDRRAQIFAISRIRWLGADELQIQLGPLQVTMRSDFNENGVVGFVDFVVFSNIFGQGTPPTDARYDLSSNGMVT